MTIEECIEIWIATYTPESQAERRRTIQNFRQRLKEAGNYDVDAPASVIRETAYPWVLSLEHPEKNTDGLPVEGHIKNRWSTLSSFYKVAVQKRVLPENPIELADRQRHNR